MRRASRVDHSFPEIARRAPSVRQAWAAYAACAWSLLFGAVHLYWVLGGTLGLPPDVVLRDTTALLVVDVVAIPLCVIGALLALALTGA